jgi:hypothetical protein
LGGSGTGGQLPAAPDLPLGSAASQTAPPQPAPTNTTASSSSANQDSNSSNGSNGTPEYERQKLLKSLSEDIYAMTVSSIFQGVTGKRLAQVVTAALVTALLQLGLLVILWTAMVNDSQVVPNEVSEVERIWTMLGQVERQICWNNHMQQRKIQRVSDAVNVTLDVKDDWAPPKDVDCFNALPDADKRRYPIWGCEVSPELQSLTECVKKYGGLSHHCRVGKKNQQVKPELYAYATGLFYPTGEDIFSEIAYLNGGWAAKACGEEQDKQCIEYNYSSHASCISLWQNKGSADPSLANLLAILVLAVYAQDEARRAVWLGYVAAALSGILPSFYNKLSLTTVRPPNFLAVGSVAWPLCVIALAAPLLQFLVVVLMLLSSVAFSLTKEGQTSIIAIIINAAALTFLLDLDNKVGVVLRSQHQQWDRMQQGEGPMALTAQQLPKHNPGHWTQSLMKFAAGLNKCGCIGQQRGLMWRKFAGHVFFSVLGALVFLQWLLVTPFLASLLITVVLNQKDKPGDTAPFSDGKLGDSPWSEMFTNMGYVFGTGWISMPWVVALGINPYVAPLVACTAIAFPLLLALLFFGQPLPSVAKRWSPTLLAMICLSVAIGLIVAIPAWLGMFVIWPTCHRWRQQQQLGAPAAGLEARQQSEHGKTLAHAQAAAIDNDQVQLDACKQPHDDVC